MYQAYLKRFLIKLKTTSLYRLLLNNQILIVIAISLLLLSFHDYVYLVFFGIFLIYLHQVNKEFLMIVSIILILIGGLFLINKHNLPTVRNDITNGSGKVIKIDYFDDYQKIEILSSDGKIILYDSYTTNLKVGMSIEFTGKAHQVHGQRTFKGFDYAKYLQRKKIIGIVNSKEIVVVNDSFDYRVIRQSLYLYLRKYFSKESYTFLQGMILGDASIFDELFYSSLTEIGVIHLFSISGLHIQLFIGLLVSLLQKLSIREKYINYLIIALLLFYLVITSWSPSVLRASLMYILNEFNRSYNLQLSSLDIVSFVFILLLMINPLFIYHYGFLLSFSVSMIIILTSDLVASKNNTMQVLIISWCIQVLSFPIVNNLHSKFNLVSPFINVIYIFLISSFLLPFSIIVMFFPFLDKIFNPLIILFRRITIFINNTFSINVHFPKFSCWQTILYLGSLFFIIKFFFNRRIRSYLIGLFLILFFGISNSNVLKPFGEVYFLDLHHGESIIIKEPFDQCNIVIDTGDGKNNVVTNFLEHHGFKRIDFLILTHDHADHNGEAISIINTFKVKNIVVSQFDQSVISQKYSTVRVKTNDIIKCGKLELYVLNPDKNKIEENDNSIVLLTTINQKNFLFTGDATISIEKELITKFNLQVDILKVGHHGSKTSTSAEFVASIKPKYAIIMNGSVEKFGFPHSEVLEILNNYHVTTLTTKKYNSIGYRYYRHKQGIFYSVNGKI